MSFSAGVYTLPSGNPVVSATAITISWCNTTLQDIGTALSTCLLKDGTQTATAQVPFAAGLTAGAGAFAIDASGNLAVTTNKFTIAAATGAWTAGNGTIGVGSNVTFTLGDASGVNSATIRMIPSSTQKNWQIAASTLTAGALTFSPSTASGGSTFTTPALTLDSSGNMAVSGALTLTGVGGAGTGVVSVGAADSGAAGFRLLRIPN